MSVKKWNLPKLILAVLCVLGPLLGWLVFGERGLLYLYRSELDRQQYIERIKQLHEQNQAMLDEIEKLRNDMEYIEHLARTELNMVKKNEIIYRFEEKSARPESRPSEVSEKIAGAKNHAESTKPE